jgi:hypothetical protein
MKTLFLLVFPHVKMKTIPLFHSIIVIGFFTILSTGCQKGEVVGVEVEPEFEYVYTDSLYFEVEGKSYSAISTGGAMYWANSGVDLTFLEALVRGYRHVCIQLL